MLSLADARHLSTRVFLLRVEHDVVGSLDVADGLTLFVEAIRAYEGVVGISDVAATEVAAAASAAAALVQDAGDAIERLNAALEEADIEGGSSTVGINGAGIASLVRVTAGSESDGANVWRATSTDGTEHDFTVLNGEKREKGETAPTARPRWQRSPQSYTRWRSI